MKTPFDYRLYVITDGQAHLLSRLEEILKGGATCVQYREKTKPFHEMVKEATQIKQLCHAYDVPLFINDHIELAKEIQADGLHLGQGDATLIEAKKILGDLPIGISADDVAQAQEAEKNGAAYVGVGALFPTASKPDATIVSFETAAAIKKSIDIPMLLIGGITLERAKNISVPYDGLCFISELFLAQNKTDKTRQLKDWLMKAVEKPT